MTGDLLIEVGGGKRTAFTIAVARKGIIIGRSSTCEFVVDDPTVSSKHCLIRWEGNGWIVRDLRSRNGVIVNGTRVPEQALAKDDVITIGRMRIRVVACPQGDTQPPGNFLRFLCACGLSYVAPLSHAGREFKCMSCGKVMEVPERKAAP
jgi:hypothetical protein